MKQSLKFVFLILALFTVFTLFSACGKKEETNLKQTEESLSFSETEEEEEYKVKNGVVPFDMEQIKWNVTEGLIKGDRKIVFNFTNQSKVSILEFDIEFREKKDLDPKEKETLYQYLIEEFSLDEEESTKIEKLDFAMSAKSERLVNPDEQSSNMPLYYFNGYYYVKKLSHFDLVEPDVATIRYVHEGKIHTAYYDFIGKSYSKEEGSDPSFYWTESALGKKLPKPDAEVVEKYFFDSESNFGITAWGMSSEDFAAYKDLCIKNGFDQNTSQWEGYYSAKNAEGYKISIRFDADKYNFDASISVPEKTNDN